MNSFTTFVRQEKEKSQEALLGYWSQHFNQYQHLDPTFKTFLSPLSGYLTAGGKWLRPLLVRLGYGIAGGKQEGNVVLGSVTSEVFHRFILCHDDIIDGDTLRHGQATLEAHYETEGIVGSFPRPLPNYGQAMAIIAGDVIQSLVTDMIVASNFSPSVTQALLKGYHHCLMETAAGWRLETILKQQAISQVTQKQVEQAMFLVSASYSIIWPLRLGYLMAGKKMDAGNDHLENFGTHAGMAYQIIDDMLGIFGESHKTGKPVGNDIREGKKSLLILKAYTLANTQEKQELEHAFGNQRLKPEAIKGVQTIIQATKALEWTQAQADSHITQAKQAVQHLASQTEETKRLKQLAEFVGQRDY